MTVIRIEEDYHNERPGYFRAYYANDLMAPFICTVIGYCSSGGSHKTIRATVAEVRRIDRTTPIYRNNRQIA